ncbi:hypothetical protein GCM10028812_13560 [Ancylobacter sonchi]
MTSSGRLATESPAAEGAEAGVEDETVISGRRSMMAWVEDRGVEDRGALAREVVDLAVRDLAVRDFVARDLVIKELAVGKSTIGFGQPVTARNTLSTMWRSRACIRDRTRLSKPSDAHSSSAAR